MPTLRDGAHINSIQDLNWLIHISYNIIIAFTDLIEFLGLG